MTNTQMRDTLLEIRRSLETAPVEYMCWAQCMCGHVYRVVADKRDVEPFDVELGIDVRTHAKSDPRFVEVAKFIIEANDPIIRSHKESQGDARVYEVMMRARDITGRLSYMSAVARYRPGHTDTSAFIAMIDNALRATGVSSGPGAVEEKEVALQTI